MFILFSSLFLVAKHAHGLGRCWVSVFEQWMPDGQEGHHASLRYFGYRTARMFEF